MIGETYPKWGLSESGEDPKGQHPGVGGWVKIRVFGAPILSEDTGAKMATWGQAYNMSDQLCRPEGF